MLLSRELTVAVQTGWQSYKTTIFLCAGETDTCLFLRAKIKNKFNSNRMFLELNSEELGFTNRNFSDKMLFGINNLFLIQRSKNSLKQIINNQKKQHQLINERELNENKTNTNRMYALLYGHTWKPPS